MRYILFYLALFISFYSQAQSWVDKTYQHMSLEEKVGQLFMVGITTSDPPELLNRQLSDIQKFNVGGVAFLAGMPEVQIDLTNRIQSNASLGVLIAMDAEWGVAMRFKTLEPFPWAMAMGSLQDTQWTRELGNRIGQDLRRMGVHMNFAPVADINVHPLNPIIGNRSFGSSPQRVMEHAKAYAQGLSDSGVLSCAKHFPGHGDTAQDSHKTLPQVVHQRKRLNQVELFPYQTTLLDQVDAVMVAHLDVPELTHQPGQPSSLSKAVVTDLLIDELSFNGLVITDALNMKGVSQSMDPGQVAVEAFLAGNDILLIPVDLAAGVQSMMRAISTGKISEARLAHSVKKILTYKYQVGLAEKPGLIHKAEVMSYLASNPHSDWIEQVYTRIPTQEKATDKSIANTQNIGYITFGAGDTTQYQEVMNQWGAKPLIYGNEYEAVVVSIHVPDSSPYTSYRLSAESLEQIARITSRYKNNYALVFGSPYALTQLGDPALWSQRWVMYLNKPKLQSLGPDVLSGKLINNNRLPTQKTTER